MKKKRPADSDKLPKTVDAEFKEAAELPAHTAKKPSADEQEGDWSGDKDYE